MSGEFRFETFVDVHSNIFNEYLSSVIAKLPKENEEYRAVQVKIKKLYEKYPKVFGVFDMEKSAELTEEECAAHNADRLQASPLSFLFSSHNLWHALCPPLKIPP